MTEDDESEAVAAAIDILYAGPPDQFMEQRSTLSRAARDGGNPSAARAITALRRPTAAAAVVNRWVRREPDAIDRLLDAGAHLRAAHEALDADQMRELTTERRSLVAELSRSALEQFGPDSPSAALRDDVSSSFDAAVADPEIAGRLGILIRPEHWSGFGVAPADGPGLTLVQGGKAVRKPGRPRSVTAKPIKKSPDPEPTATPPDSPPAADRRRSKRILAKARETFDNAEQAQLAAQQDEQAGIDSVRRLSDQLADLTRQLGAAKSQLDSARRTVKSVRARRREARSALDRAERNAPTS